LVDAVGHTDATLIVAGEGEQQDVQTLMARSSPNVQWWGWTEPAKLFEAIDVLVVPSLWREPFGLVVVEAARSGLPVLIADQPGLREAVSSCGARFHTFPAGDSAALRAALKEPTDRYRVEQAQPPTVDIVDLVAQRIPGSAR
jgi:glycosyltransferase involved in cell wall biosynthesis